MEKADKTRGFSVRETKLDNGQVKLKLAVLPVPKRDQHDSSSSYCQPSETCALPEHCSASEPVTPAPLPDNRGKWRPIGFAPVDQPAVPCHNSEPFLSRSCLTSPSSASLLLPSSTESTPFLSCFGAASAGVLFDSSVSSLKPFQVAAVVKPSSQSVANFASPVSQLYRSASAVSSQVHPLASVPFKLNIFSQNDRLVSSGSDTDDEDDAFGEKRHSPLFSPLTSSGGYITEAANQTLPATKKSSSQRPLSGPSRKKRREIDDLLNTWNVAPTAGKLLRQEKMHAVDSNKRISRSTAAAVSSDKQSPDKSQSAHIPSTAVELRSGRSAEKKAVGKIKQPVSSKSEEAHSRPLVTQEQIEAVLSKLSRVVVSPAKSEPPVGRPLSRSRSFKFLSNLPPHSVTAITQKRYCSSVVPNRSDEALSSNEASSSTQLPPKKRHRQLSPLPHSHLPTQKSHIDATTLSNLVERQSAAIAFLRPSLFDLKHEHEERLYRMRLPVSHFPPGNLRQLQKSSRNVTTAKSTASHDTQQAASKVAPAQVSVVKEKDQPQIERHPLKLRISLSKILASRAPVVAEAGEAGSHIARLRTSTAHRVAALKRKAKLVTGKVAPSSYSLRASRSSDAPCEAVTDQPKAKAAIIQPIVKKPGRGRPRKDAAMPKREAETEPFAPASVVNQTQPRGRGRPPSKARQAQQTPQQPGNVAAETLPDLPRKSELKEEKAMEKESEVDEPLSKLRKLGRPSREMEAASESGRRTSLPPPRKEKDGKPPKRSLPVKVDKSANARVAGKLLLKKIKAAKKYQLAGIFSDTYKEERNEPCEVAASELSSLASPNSEFSGSGDFVFSPMHSPVHGPQPQQQPEKHSGAILPLPPPVALSVLYERSYFELPHDLWILNKHGLLTRPSHPGETFRRVRNNIYTPASRHIYGQKAEPPEPCKCQMKDDQICTDDCINKQLFVECSADSCPCFDKCANRLFQTGGDTSKIARFETAQCGSGVRAKKMIQKGHFIIEYTGEVVGEREFRRRMVEWYSEDEHHYAFNLEGGAVIDAYRMGSLARFVNHSCEPNCQMQKWTVLGLPRVGLFALRDIQPGEELTYDYNFNWFDQGSRQVCRCGAEQCRGYIGAARRNSVSSAEANPKKMIQPVEKWRLSNPPRPFSVREYQLIEEGRVILRRNVRSMSRKLSRLIAKKKQQKNRKSSVVIAQAGATSHGSNSGNGGNSLFMAQFKALSTSRSVSTRCLSEAESSSVSRSVDMALFLEQILTSLMMHRDKDGNQTSAPFLSLPRRKQCPQYYDRVAKPVDFSTIERNVTAGRYPTFDSFNDDVRLLLDNVKLGCDLLNSALDPEKTFCELADTYDKLLRDFESEIIEFRKIFPSVELEDVVRCICGRLNEEGTMVQCEKCQLWQHTDCVGVNVHAMPDSYSCYVCSKVPVCKEILLPTAQLPPDAQPGCRYYLTLCTKTGLQVRVDECYTINRQSLPFDVPFCNIDKLFPGIFYIDRLFVDPTGKKFIYGVHLVYPFEIHVDHSRRFFPKEVLATLWYDKLPVEIISEQCWVLDSSVYARGRPRAANSEELVFICDNGLDKHAKAMHKLNEPMASICTKRYAFDHFLVPLRPERNMTAGEIHERMFALRREELAQQAAAAPVAPPSSLPSLSTSSESSSVVGSPLFSKNENASGSDDDDELPLSKLSEIEASRKRLRLNKIAEKLADKAGSVKLDPDTIPDWLVKPNQKKAVPAIIESETCETSKEPEKCPSPTKEVAQVFSDSSIPKTIEQIHSVNSKADVLEKPSCNQPVDTQGEACQQTADPDVSLPSSNVEVHQNDTANASDSSGPENAHLKLSASDSIIDRTEGNNRKIDNLVEQTAKSVSQEAGLRAISAEGETEKTLEMSPDNSDAEKADRASVPAKNSPAEPEEEPCPEGFDFYS